MYCINTKFSDTVLCHQVYNSHIFLVRTPVRTPQNSPSENQKGSSVVRHSRCREHNERWSPHRYCLSGSNLFVSVRPSIPVRGFISVAVISEQRVGGQRSALRKSRATGHPRQGMHSFTRRPEIDAFDIPPRIRFSNPIRFPY